MIIPVDARVLHSTTRNAVKSNNKKKQVGIDFEKDVWLQEEPGLRGKRELLLFGLLGEEHSLDVRQNTTLGDGNSGEKLVKFLVVTDGQLQVTWDDTGLLVITSSVTGKFENLSSEVLHDGSQVNGSSSTNAVGVVALAKETMDPTHGELKSGPRRTGFGLSLDLSAFTSSRHDEVIECFSLRVNKNDGKGMMKICNKKISCCQTQRR